MLEFKLKDFADFQRQSGIIQSGLNKGFDGGKPVLIQLMRPKRNNLTNAKLHAMMTDIHAQAVIKMPGARIVLSEFSFDELKTLLVIWFAKERELNGEPLSRPPKHFTDPTTGENLVVRPSTTEFCQRDACDFVEYIYALGCDCNIKWSEKAQHAYSQYID